MHDTALISGKGFSETYGKEGMLVIDIGGLDFNGSLKQFFISKGMNYLCIDMKEHHSVDILVKPGEKLPFDNGSVDMIISTSCFEHDPCYWMTFKEMCRVVKLGGYIYVNAPSNGPYHCYPGDNWRFYSDAGQALAYWSGVKISAEEVFPVKVVETFHILPTPFDIWIDFVCVWERVNDIDKNITTSNEMVTNIGKLESYINENGLKTEKKITQ